MGGKNHQPCREYLPISTQMSRFASLAFAHLELANVALEDVLLAEMNGGVGDLDGIKSQLTLSQKGVGDLVDTIVKLKTEMKQRGFRDLLAVHPVDLDTIGRAFVANNMVSVSAWGEVSRNARTGGFNQNIALIHTHAQTLAEYTAQLHEKVNKLQGYANNGSVMQVLEENLQDNLKPEFAKLYCAWNQFQEIFLASSLLSTEVDYAFNGFGSLVDVSAQSSVA